MKLVVVAEKPSVISALLPSVHAAFGTADPASTVTIVTGHPAVALNRRFEYPKRLRWSDYPLVTEPRYRPYDIHLASVGTRPTSGPIRGMPRLTADESWAALSGADVVALAPDPSPSSFLVTQAMLDACVKRHGPMRGDLLLCDVVAAYGGKPLDVLGAWDHAHPWLAYARNRRRFDYNFDVNALGVLGRTLALAGIPATVWPPSKFELQALYALRAREPLTEGGLIDAMARWTGTGRYARDVEGSTRYTTFGSPASRAAIVGYLLDGGLAHGGERDRMLVSARGRDLLDLLHPDCEDPDLPFRLDEWCRQPVEIASTRIDRYIRTFFGKQARHAPRKAARLEATVEGVIAPEPDTPFLSAFRVTEA